MIQFIASFIYRKFRSINGALVAFFAAIIATTGVMLLLNIFVTPIYLFDYLKVMPEAAAREYVMSILPTILLPFNASKALLNSSVAMLLYKPLTVAFAKAKLVQGKATKLTFNKYSIVIIVVGTITLAAAIVSFVIINNA